MQPTTQPAPKNGIRVLCIEDEHFISELYARALGKAGYDATFVSDGQVGLTQAQTDAFDIILIDLMVPTIDGIEILRTLRNPSKTPHLKARILIITNLEQREEVRADIERQADGYIIKANITPRELVETLNGLKLANPLLKLHSA